MKFLSTLVLCLLSINLISAHSSKRAIVFKSARKCAKENKVDFKTVTKFVKGNFSKETENAKCFLKCVANDLDFWIGEKPQISNMVKYVDLLVKDTEGIDDVIQECITEDVSENFCDHLYNVYQCFVAQAKIKKNYKVQAPEDILLSNELKKQ